MLGNHTAMSNIGEYLPSAVHHVLLFHDERLKVLLLTKRVCRKARNHTQLKLWTEWSSVSSPICMGFGDRSVESLFSPFQQGGPAVSCQLPPIKQIPQPGFVCGDRPEGG